jgi:sporulation protein YlmC with PRC-barrel domain
MRKLGILTAILFVFTLFAGQAFADDKMKGQYDKMKGQYGEGQFKDTNRASEFMGKDVKDLAGENIGTVDDVVFDNQGNINYIILSRGGVAGIGADLVPIPFKAEKFSFQEDTIVLSMDQQKLEKAPSFSSGEWDELSRQEFQQRVHGYYGTEKYQEKHKQQ